MAFALTLLGAALACALEMLEALAIVLAVALERRPREAVLGAIAGVAACVVIGVALGPALTDRIGLGPLRVIVGVALLWFGGNWLRKGVLRLAGRKRRSSSFREFEEERAEMHEAPAARAGVDWVARTVAFKGVFLEGLEVVLIVSALGARPGGRTPALLGVLLATVLTAAIGVALHRPLRRAPETELKFVVGLVLVSFGTFFGGEGLGVHWPGADAFLPALVVVYAALSLGLVALLRRRRDAREMRAPA